MSTYISNSNFYLKQSMAKSSNVFNVAHLNSRSLFCHIDEVRDLFRDVNAHAIGVSETHLKSKTRSKAIEVEGFRIIRNDRKIDACGGVALYLRKEYKYTVIGASETDDIEFLFVEVRLKFTKLLIGVFYKRPLFRDIAKLEEILSNYVLLYDNVVLVGDFNVDLLIDNSYSDKMRTIIHSFSLEHVQYGPTHFCPTSSTLLDLSIVPKNAKLHNFGQISIPGISDHDVIFVGLKLDNKRERYEVKVFRNFKGIDNDLVLSDCNNLPWSHIYNTPDIHIKVSLFNSYLNDILNKHVPYKTVRVNKINPWFNAEIRLAMKKRDKAYNAWKNSKLLTDKKVFTRLRNGADQLNKSLKKSYMAELLDTSQPSKKLWNNLRSIGAVKCTESFVSNFSLNDICASFIYKNKDSRNFSVQDLCCDNFSEEHDFSFRNVNDQEVRRAIFEVKSNAVGVDNIPLNFIKMLLPVILPVITHIFNYSLTSSIFPVSWKLADAVPIPKKSSPSNLCDFRAINLLPGLSKAFENVIRHQLLTHVNSKSLLNEFQSGFRPYHGTFTALTKISEDILPNLGLIKFTPLVLLDFSKAFDALNHDLLLLKLKHYFGFSVSACNLLRSYLTGRFMKLSEGSNSSNYYSTSHGVPQGSVLGPILFSIYINDLPNILEHCKHHLYADDLQIYMTGKFDNLNDCFVKINQDLLRIYDWSQKNCLLLNASKSQAVVITKNSLNPTYPALILGNDIIPVVDKVRNLGLIINSKFTWDDHVGKVASQIYNGLRQLYPFRKNMSTQLRLKLVKSLLVPSFLYCDTVYSPSISSSCRRKISVVFNACLRYINNLHYRDHVSSYVNDIFGFDIFTYYQFRLASFVHKLIETKQPQYLSNSIVLASSTRTFNIISQRQASSAVQMSTLNSSIRIFNSLPIHLKRIKANDNFKVNVKEYFKSLN